MDLLKSLFKVSQYYKWVDPFLKEELIQLSQLFDSKPSKLYSSTNPCPCFLERVFRIFVSAGANRGTSLKTGIGSMQGTFAGFDSKSLNHTIVCSDAKDDIQTNIKDLWWKLIIKGAVYGLGQL